MVESEFMLSYKPLDTEGYKLNLLLRLWMGLVNHNLEMMRKAVIFPFFFRITKFSSIPSPLII